MAEIQVLNGRYGPGRLDTNRRRSGDGVDEIGDAHDEYPNRENANRRNTETDKAA